MMKYFLFITLILLKHIPKRILQRTDCDKLLEGRTYTFISKHLGCTIDVYYGLINPGTRIISHAILIPDVVGVQQFYLKKVPGTTDSYNMINVHSALVMDMSGNASKLEYPICNSLYQQFSFVPSKSGTCSIYANTKQNGKLAVSNVLTVSCNGFNSLILTTAENSSDQEWSITEVQPPENWVPTYYQCANKATNIFKHMENINFICIFITIIFLFK